MLSHLSAWGERDLGWGGAFNENQLGKLTGDRNFGVWRHRDNTVAQDLPIFVGLPGFSYCSLPLSAAASFLPPHAPPVERGEKQVTIITTGNQPAIII